MMTTAPVLTDLQRVRPDLNESACTVMNGSVKNEIDDIEQELNFEALTFQDVDNSNEIEKEPAISNGVYDEISADVESRPISREEKRILENEEHAMQNERLISSAQAEINPQSDNNGGNGILHENKVVVETRPAKLGPADFELLKVIGKGAFGKVFQVRNRHTGEIYAMKVMSKTNILDKGHSEYIQAESHILKNVLHPFVVTLRYSFQTSHKLYLVMDFINGGHLFYNLYKEKCFKSQEAKYFTAEIVSAISHLHSLGYVHRDLKPENVLLDRDGHIRITDFGLAKFDMTEETRANSFVGTIEYMAPEIISGNGHGKCVDWWSVGILLFEMLTGLPPFRHKNQQVLRKQIIGGKLKLPPYLTDESRNLIKLLLQRDPSKRLGYGPNGSQDVKRHKFFAGLNWNALEEKRNPSPFKPDMTGDHHSVEMFNTMWTDQKAIDSPPPSPAKSPAGAHTNFYNFSYTAPSTLAAHLQAMQASE